MGDDQSAAEFFAGYGLDDVPRFSDPQCRLYRSFVLRRGSILQLFGPFVWWRGIAAGFGSGFFLSGSGTTSGFFSSTAG